ncbi:hypothetical protein LSH36_37g00035, partial [Paralvinella palmiformis]
VLDRDGHFLTSFGTVGSADGEFDYPHSCFCTQQDTIIVTDVFNHRVQIFTRFGQFLSKFGRLGSEDGQFEAPSGVAMDTTGPHLRTFGTPDTLPNDLHRPHYSFLVVFTQDGELIYSFGSQGDRAGQFHGPEGIAVANAGDVVVAECGGQRIQLFSFADLIQ